MYLKRKPYFTMIKTSATCHNIWLTIKNERKMSLNIVFKILKPII